MSGGWENGASEQLKGSQRCGRTVGREPGGLWRGGQKPGMGPQAGNRILPLKEYPKDLQESFIKPH